MKLNTLLLLTLTPMLGLVLPVTASAQTQRLTFARFSLGWLATGVKE